MANGNGLASIEHVVVLMLENRRREPRPGGGQPSHLEEIRDELVSRQMPAGAHALPSPGALP